jgi:SAM-dependent methyltransferase
VDAATVRALQHGAGAALLEEATSAYGSEDALALGTRLRAAGHPADLVSAALTQARLRLRAVAKLGPDAAALLYTADGLEQATRASVAQHRAARLASALGAGARVADLGCGIGGDLLALAAAGLDVTGYERDALTAEVARANVAARGLTGRASVLEADVTAVDRSPYAAVVCDPARRGVRGRTVAPETWEPPWSFAADLLRGDAVVKVAPGIAHERIPPDVEAEWVSDGGDLVEAALWSGRLAGGARRRATVLPAGETLTEADDPGAADVSPPLAHLYEPDDAVIRAGLVTAVAALVRGALLDPKIAYVTADALVATPYARAYAVRDVLPYDEKRLRAWVRAHEVGSLTIKKRGVAVAPEQLRRRLRPTGDRAATLVLTRTPTGARALVVDPA